MKIALCTTTIHVPHALKLMRKCSPDKFSNVKFFVAGDEKSPHDEIYVLCDTTDSGKNWDVATQSHKHEDDNMRRYFGNSEYYNAQRQNDLGYKCSKAIGFNTLARRNIAFLEALKWGADVIYSWDNDNAPTSPYHFVPFDGPWIFDGLKVEAPEWFDPGFLLIPRTRHRGIPSRRLDAPRTGTVTDAKIGVAAGLIIGNPDVDASTRIELKPDIAQAHLLGQTGIVVDPNTWTVFNTQNTAVIRELIPAWFLMPGVGRHDDIYASLIVQRVARERELHVHFGPPFCYQERNEHNLIADLRAEIDGMERVQQLAAFLDSIALTNKSVIADTRIIYEALRTSTLVPYQAVVAALAWLEDCESVL